MIRTGEKSQKMKSVVIFALFVAIATAATSGDHEFHLHLNLKNTASNSVVRTLISRYVDKVAHQTNQHDVELHLHVDDMTDEELELFGFGDIFGGIKKGIQTVAKGVTTGAKAVAKGVTTGAQTVAKGVTTGANAVAKGVTTGANAVAKGATTGANAVAQGVQQGVKQAGKGFSIVGQAIGVAIQETEKAFNHVKKDIETIILPKINIPKLIEITINVAKLAVKLIPCGMAIKKAAPAFFNFAKSAAAGSAGPAVQSLMSMLQYMPEITEKCVGKPFNIPSKIMSKVQCAADIVGLAAVVGQLILAPENIIASVNGITSLVTLIPNTISDCTGAFQ